MFFPIESNPTTTTPTGTPPTTSPTPVTALTTDTITPVTLDINKSKDTDQFNFKKNGNFRTYTPKDGNVFSKIIKKPLVGSCVEIWESKEDDHGLKAVLMGSKKEPKHLALLLKSGNFVLLRKTGKNKNWSNITSKRRDVTKLRFLGENDNELKSSDYKASLVDLFYEITFNDGVSCRKITYADAEVWNHVDDTKFSEIKKLSVDLPSNNFSVTNKSDEVKKIEKEFKNEGEDEGAPITLNIKNKQSTSEYEYSKDGNFHTYTPKPGNVFTKISQGNTVLWESKDDVYGTLVSIKLKEGVSVILAILLTDNSFKLFNDYVGTKQDLTSQRHDPSNLKFFLDNDTELTNSDFKVTLQNLSYTFLFNAGVNCKKITYNDNPLWTPTDDPKYSEIKSFKLDLATNKFHVMNQSNQTKHLGIIQSIGTPTTPQSGTGTPQTTPPGTTQGTPTTPSSGTSGGTQQSGAGSTPASQSQSQQSQSSTHSARNGTQSQSVKTATTPTGGTQPPRASGTSSASPSQSPTPGSGSTTTD